VNVTSWAVIFRCYGPSGWMGDWRPTVAQHKTVTHAMHSFVRKFPQYALMGGQGRRLLHLYERADPMSVLWVELNVARRGGNPISYQDARQVAEERAALAAPPRRLNDAPHRPLTPPSDANPASE
jgi:hypothetical protein